MTNERRKPLTRFRRSKLDRHASPNACQALGRTHSYFQTKIGTARTRTQTHVTRCKRVKQDLFVDGEEYGAVPISSGQQTAEGTALLVNARCIKDTKVLYNGGTCPDTSFVGTDWHQHTHCEAFMEQFQPILGGIEGAIMIIIDTQQPVAVSVVPTWETVSTTINNIADTRTSDVDGSARILTITLSVMSH